MTRATATLSLALILSLAPALAPPPAHAETCQERAERFKGLIEADVRRRQISEAVAKNLLPEVEKAGNLCRAGKTAEGERMLAGISKNFGYH